MPPPANPEDRAFRTAKSLEDETTGANLAKGCGNDGRSAIASVSTTISGDCAVCVGEFGLIVST